MKKALLLLNLMLVAAASWATRWTAPTEYDYPVSTPLYVKVVIDDVVGPVEPQIDEIAAFVMSYDEAGGTFPTECRAVATQPTYITNPQTQEREKVYLLRVWGTEEEVGKSVIFFRAVYNGIVYRFSSSSMQTFDGEAETHPMPVELKLTAMSDLKFEDNPINLELGGEGYNLAQHLQQCFGANKTPLVYPEFPDTQGMTMEEMQEALNAYGAEMEAMMDNLGAIIDEESMNLYTDFIWTDGYSDYVDFDEQSGLITPKALTPEDRAITLSLPYGYTDENGTQHELFRAEANVVVSLPAVSEIVVSPLEINAHVGDMLADLIGGANDGKPVTVSMLPELAGQDFHWEIPAESSDWIVNDMIYGPGDWPVLIYSDANPDLEPVQLIIHATEPLRLAMDVYPSVGMAQGGTVRIGFTGDVSTLDLSKLAFEPETVYSDDNKAFVATLVTPSGSTTALQGDEESGYYVEYAITPRYVGTFSFQVNYDGEPLLNNYDEDYFELNVYPQLALTNGWQWVSPYAYGDDYETLFDASDASWAPWLGHRSDANHLVEMRTQNALLYNDVNYGLFGDIQEFDYMNGMYKVKFQTQDNVYYRDMADPESNYEMWFFAADGDPVQIAQGYNWICYPYEFPLTFNELSDSWANASEGDQIIRKDGEFAEFSDGNWITTDMFSSFTPGEGYLYYRAAEGESDFAFMFDKYENVPEAYQGNILVPVVEPTEGNPQPAPARRRVKRVGEWTVDASRFADAMSIVAEVPQLDNPDEWTLGAFVDDECRGMGRAVRGNIMFVGVVGKAGDHVTFRLHNDLTGKEITLNETLNYGGKAGSLRKPLTLTAPVATGINGINGARKANVIYDMGGRQITGQPQKGIYVVNGQKVVLK